MKHSKEEVETVLYDMLHEALGSYNQEDALISLDYNEEKEECVVRLNVTIIEEDSYVGFAGY